MSAELIKQKLEIAKRAGELNEEVENLAKLLDEAKFKKDGGYELRINVASGSSNQQVLSTYRIDRSDLFLHDAIIQYLEKQITKRHDELNDLIKVLQ